MSTSSVRLDTIRVDGSTQTRAAINMAAVEEYAAAIARGETLPPVELVFDGEVHWIVDGYHRVHAYLRAGHPDVSAMVSAGTCENAIWKACAANKTHGLKRTNADKRRAVELALRHPMGAAMSNVAIAEHCNVHQSTVANVRNELTDDGKIRKTSERTGKDGRTRDTSKIGRKKADAQDVTEDADADAPPEPVDTAPLRLVGGTSTKTKKRGPKPTPADEAEGIRALATALGNIRTQWRCKSLVWSEGSRRDMVFATRRCNEIVKAIRAVEQVLEDIARECDASGPALASG